MAMEPELIEKFKRAGALTGAVREFAQSQLKEGAKLLDIATAIEAKICQLGGRPAFPVNISINDIAAHYTPKANDSTMLKAGDLVKIDFGAHIDGAAGDIAFSVSIGNSAENAALIAAAEAALAAAIQVVKPGVEVRALGAAIAAVVEAAGFRTIRNLSGHGLARFDLHAPPSIPNFDNADSTKLERGSIIAIEPFVTTGRGFVAETEACEIYRFVRFAPIRDREVLRYIQSEFGTLPFARRWLIARFGVARSTNALREGLARGALAEHKILREVSGGKVAQAEHTLLVADKVLVLTK